MKCQILFSRKNMKNIISLLFAEFAHSMVSVNWIATVQEVEPPCRLKTTYWDRNKMSQTTSFPTILHVQPAKTQISLHIRGV